MKILVAGATGALGKQLVPRLVAAGHEVVGMTRSVAKRNALRAMPSGVPRLPAKMVPLFKQAGLTVEEFALLL